MYKEDEKTLDPFFFSKKIIYIAHKLVREKFASDLPS